MRPSISASAPVPRTARHPNWQGIPSLVDVLSVLDVALDRKESLARGFGFEHLRRVRTALEFAIFNALEDSLRGNGRAGAAPPKS